MKNDLVSVIVPVFNTEQFLDECLASLRSQSWKNLEIIVVNDGSKDNSVSVVLKHAEQDDRIRLFSQPNRGLSAARNTGLKNADGEFICFLDSDDFLLPDAIARLHETARIREADLVQGTILRKRTPGPRGAQPEEICGRGTDVLARLLSEERYIPQAWSMLLRRSFLLGNRLDFEEGMIHEDELFTPKCFFLAAKVVRLEYPFYFYRKRHDSIMGTTPPAVSLLHWTNLASHLLDFVRNEAGSDTDTSQCQVALFDYLSMRGALLYGQLSKEEREGFRKYVPRTQLPLLGFFAAQSNAVERLHNCASFKLGRLLLAGPGKIYRAFRNHFEN